jgi:hypothetical protein
MGMIAGERGKEKGKEKRRKGKSFDEPVFFVYIKFFLKIKGRL